MTKAVWLDGRPDPMARSQMRSRISTGRAAFVCTLLAIPAVAQSPVGTAFTFQGQLKDAGSPATGTFDFEFELFDAETLGNQIGSTLKVDDVNVTAGQFSVVLDFGDVFQGDARWLGIAVRPGASAELDPFTTLSPRQELTPTPNALHAADTASLGGQTAPFYLDLSNSTGVLSIDRGGTGATTAEEARLAIGAAPLVPQTGAMLLSTLDSMGDVGQEASITIGGDGLGLISYVDVTAGTLKVAHCIDTVCSAATVSTLDTIGAGTDPFRTTSITTGSDGLGLIAYRDSTEDSLKTAHCDNEACTTATVTTHDTGGFNSSIATGLDGLGVISYSGLETVEVAHCDNAACDSSSVAIVSSPLHITRPAIAISYTAPRIAFGAGGQLWTVSCATAGCETAGGQAGPLISGDVYSLTIAPGGASVLTYSDAGFLRVGVCEIEFFCATFVSSREIAEGARGVVVMGSDGLPFVASNDLALRLATTRCADPLCSILQRETYVASAASSVAVAIGTDGIPLLAFYDAGDLWAGHCPNEFCSVFPRR